MYSSMEQVSAGRSMHVAQACWLWMARALWRVQLRQCCASAAAEQLPATAVRWRVRSCPLQLDSCMFACERPCVPEITERLLVCLAQLSAQQRSRLSEYFPLELHHPAI